MNIELLRADTTSLKADAIVSPTADSARTGTASVITGGNLLCRFVIQTVLPRGGEKDEDAKLRAATTAALQRGEELAIATLAFATMKGDIFGVPLERCARAMLAATIDFRPRARSLRRVIYCLYGGESYAIFDRVKGELEA
jgi:O-acetyl-ADP-ribose deacetylase (regulator of RNase III)